LPVLVDLEHRAVASTCAGRTTYLVVGALPDGGALRRACAPSALEPVLEAFPGSVYRCSRLRQGPVRDPTLGLVAPARLVGLRRLTT
jgi:hypothetical protein